MPTFVDPNEWKLESGRSLPELVLEYRTYGEFRPGISRVIWVCHALTANAAVDEWWPGMFGQGKPLDPETCFIVCANNPGSCYGSIGPLSPIGKSQKALFAAFPHISTRDIADAFERLKRHLRISQIDILIGASLGGQIALEWAITHPDSMQLLLLIATNAKHSAWGIAFNEAQRMAIKADPSFGKAKPEAGSNGLKAARAIALLSYRHYKTYQTFQEGTWDNGQFKAVTYQQHQGEKLAQRFNAYSYWVLSHAMDAHDVGKGRESIAIALNSIKANTLVIGIGSDVLFPPIEQKYLATHIPKARYAEIHSIYGHDGFLIETAALSEIIFKEKFIQTKPRMKSNFTC